MDFLQSQLLREVNIITDKYVAEDRSIIICDRKNRNQIGKHVGGNFSLLKLPEGETVIVNSEAVFRINALDMQFAYCEGEGAGVRFTARNHLQENVMVVFNDTDALFYCMQRDRVSNEFSHEFCLEIVYTSNTTRF